MDNYKIVNAEQLDKDLTSIADSIRTKTGRNDQLSFPQGFKEQIDKIVGMGGLKDYIEGTSTEIVLSSIKVLYNGFSQSAAVTSIKMFDVETIGESAFFACRSLVTVEFSDCLQDIGTNAFYNCSNLSEVTFKNKPINIRYPFINCSNLITINVPWSEGEVSGAPWGATNATINYNYTEG